MLGHVPNSIVLNEYIVRIAETMACLHLLLLYGHFLLRLVVDHFHEVAVHQYFGFDVAQFMEFVDGGADADFQFMYLVNLFVHFELVGKGKLQHLPEGDHDAGDFEEVAVELFDQLLNADDEVAVHCVLPASELPLHPIAESLQSPLLRQVAVPEDLLAQGFDFIQHSHWQIVH